MLPFRKKSKNSAELTALQILQNGVAVASAVEKSGHSALTYVGFCEQTAPLEHPHAIKEFLDKAGVLEHKCSLVLSQGEYQLLLIEAPDVPSEELKEAILWRVKDLVQVPVDDVVLDYFELPDDAFRGRGKMIYVVVADRNLIEKRVAWLSKLDVQPVCIDVPELALLNIAQELSLSETGTAFLLLGDQQSLVNLFSSGALYMSRGLPYNHQTHIDNIVLDLQRSMDYFESQIGCSPCVRIFVVPLQEGETPLLMELRNNLSADVQSLDLSDVVESAVSLTIDLQKRCFVAIAAALRTGLKI